MRINVHRTHASDAQTASGRESCSASRANQRKQPICPWRTGCRHSRQEHCGQRIGHGGVAANVASMQRSGIEGARQAFCAREVAPFGKTANPESPSGARSVAGRRRLQRKRRGTRRPTQQQSRFFQSLPQSGPDFSTMTHRLRPLRESPAPSWAGIGAPRFHCVASRLRIALAMPRRAPLLV